MTAFSVDVEAVAVVLIDCSLAVRASVGIASPNRFFNLSSLICAGCFAHPRLSASSMACLSPKKCMSLSCIERWDKTDGEVEDDEFVSKTSASVSTGDSGGEKDFALRVLLIFRFNESLRLSSWPCVRGGAATGGLDEVEGDLDPSSVSS